MESDTHGDVLTLVRQLGGGVHVSEVFSPPRCTEARACRRFGLTPGLAMELVTGWDFNFESDRQKCWRHVTREKPYLLVGAPDCSAFSQLKFLNPNTEAYREKLKEGIRHLEFLCKLYEYQRTHGRLSGETPEKSSLEQRSIAKLALTRLLCLHSVLILLFQA